MSASAYSDLIRRFTGKYGTVGVHTQLPRDGGAAGTDRKVDGSVKVDIYFYLLSLFAVVRLLYSAEERG